MRRVWSSFTFPQRRDLRTIAHPRWSMKSRPCRSLPMPSAAKRTPEVAPADVAQPTTWQQECLRTPRECDLILLTGKGSGKTALVPFLVMRDEAQFGADCRALFVRQSHGGGSEF